MINALDEPGVESRGRAIWMACVVCPIVTAVFVFARAYSRFFVTKRNHPSDWCCYATLPFIVAFSVTLAPATYYGMGRHIWDFTPQQTAGMYFWILVSSEFYCLALAGYKLALLLLYLQWFGIYRRYRYAVFATIFFTCAYLFANLVVQVLGCHPIRKFWYHAVPGHCTNSVASGIAFGIGHMLSDLAIAILPLPIIWTLHLQDAKARAGLAAVLGTGLFAWAVACVRFIYASVDLTSYDRTWLAGVTFLMSVLEVNVGLICGCLPALKPLFASIRDASLRSRSRRHGHSHSLASWSRSAGAESASTASDAKDALVALHDLRPADMSAEQQQRLGFTRRDTDADANDASRATSALSVDPLRARGPLNPASPTYRAGFDLDGEMEGGPSRESVDLFAGTGVRPAGFGGRGKGYSDALVQGITVLR